MKRILALLLSAALVCALLAGCGTQTGGRSDSAAAGENSAASGPDAGTADPDESTGAEDAEGPVAAPSAIDALYRQYDPEAEFLTLGDTAVTWREYFYWVDYAVSLLASYGLEPEDWGAENPVDPGYTYAETVHDMAVNYLCQFQAIRELAEAEGVTLSAQMQDQIDQDWAEGVASLGGEEQLTAYIESLYMTKEQYQAMYARSLLYDSILTARYGEDGSETPDELCAAYAEANGLLRAKHILLKTVDDGGNALSDEEIAAVQTTLGTILAQLAEAEDQQALFDELMLAYSEDTGMAYYPDGYIFKDGDMVPEFYNGALALEEGGISGPVESSYGFHIIERLPLDYDIVYEYTNDGYAYTLRAKAAEEALNADIFARVDAMQPQRGAAFADFDLAAALNDIG